MSANPTHLSKQPPVLELTFPYLFDGLNKRLRKSGWRKKAVPDSLIWAIKAQSNAVFAGPVRLEYYRHSSASRPMDFDNLVGSAKAVTDAIVKAGILPDDNPRVITERHYQHVLINRKLTPFTVIKLITL